MKDFVGWWSSILWIIFVVDLAIKTGILPGGPKQTVLTKNLHMNFSNAEKVQTLKAHLKSHSKNF